jgi:hypothetical protein
MPEFSVDSHPQKAKIIDALLAGTPLRTIGTDVIPHVSHTSLARYKASVIKPMLERAEESKRILGLGQPEKNSENGKKPTLSVPTVNQAVQNAIQDAPALQIRENRIKAKTERWLRVQKIVDGRAADMSLCETCRRPLEDHPWADAATGRQCAVFVAVPGGESGFLARDFKGSGENLQEVYKFDDALFKSFGEIEKDIAIECGQWNENAGGGAVSIQILCPAPGSGDVPRVSFAHQDAIEAAPEEEESQMQEIGVIQR